MSLTTEELQKKLDDLERDIAKGVRHVSNRDRSVDYRDYEEMKAIKRDLESSIESRTGISKKVKRVYATTSTGL